MEGVPQKVIDTLNKLRHEHEGYLSLNKVGTGYYVYKQTSSYIKGVNKSKTISEYLGKIREDGAFIKKVMTKEDELENARAIIEAYTGTVASAETIQEKPATITAKASDSLDEDDKKILMALSMNGRIEAPYMKKIMGIKKEDINYRIQRLEKRFDIKYTAFVEPDSIGYEEYLAFIKFEGDIPNAEKIKKEVCKEPRIQHAIITSGAYDIMLYLLVEKEEYLRRNILQNLEQNLFPSFDVKWTFTPFLRTYGCAPIRDEFFEDVLKNRIWHRTGERPRPDHNQITQREYAVLRELSANGKEDFIEIDKKYGFDKGRSQYTYHQLRSSGKIHRITIAMQKLPIKYVGILQMVVTNALGFKKGRKTLLQDIVEGVPKLINKYALVGDVAAPYGVMFLVPVTDEREFENLVEKLRKIEGTSTTITVGRSVLLGSLCYRRYDNRSRQSTWEILQETYGIKPPERIEYDQITRYENRKLDIRGLPA